MNRKLLKFATSWASVIAAIIGVVAAISTIALQSKATELAISLVTVGLALAAGAGSMYIARATKAFSPQQRVFLSYSKGEKETARELRDALASQGAKVWFDESELEPGADLRSSVAAAIESSNSVVAVMSNKVGAQLSAELRAALDSRVPVYAIISSNGPTPDLPKSANVRILRSDPDIRKVATAVLHAD